MLGMIHIWSPTFLVHLRPKFFPPSWPWTSNFKRPPFPNDNQSIKKNMIQRWLHVIRSFLQVGFHFQYQLINFVWLSSDFFSFSWRPHYLVFCGFILLSVQLSKNITKCLLYIIIHILCTHFAINLFYLYNMKT